MDNDDKVDKVYAELQLLLAYDTPAYEEDGDDEEDEEELSAVELTGEEYGLLHHMANVKCEASVLLAWVMTVLEKEYPRYLTHLTAERPNETGSLRLSKWWTDFTAVRTKHAEDLEAKERLRAEQASALASLTKEQRKALAKLKPEALKKRLKAPILGQRSLTLKTRPS